MLLSRVLETGVSLSTGCQVSNIRVPFWVRWHSSFGDNAIANLPWSWIVMRKNQKHTMAPLTFNVRSALKVPQVAVCNAIRHILQGLSSQDIHRRSYKKWIKNEASSHLMRLHKYVSCKMMCAQQSSCPVPHSCCSWSGPCYERHQPSHGAQISVRIYRCW